MRALWLVPVALLVGCGGDDPPAESSDTGTIDTGEVGPSDGGVDSAKPDTSVPTDVGSDGDADPGCPAAWTVAPAVDPSIAVPDGGGGVLLHAAATGTQNYTCTASVTASDAGASDADGGDGGDAGATTYGWTLTGPEADLKNCAAVKIGTHFASAGGPTAPEWLTIDGTFVVGARKSAYTASATTIPWLLLQATSHEGTGVLAKTQYIQRVNTTGGKAPDTGCDATKVGATTKVAYTADYWFYGTP